MKRVIFFLFIPLIVLACFVFLFLNNKSSHAKINIKVLFINQVRGVECCQKGSYEFTKKQLDLLSKYKYVATFILRYDAIKDRRFISLFTEYKKKNLFDYGVFFEITPSLAKDAGIEYKGSSERWYRAQYAYLVGYSQEERKKLIDTAMYQFKQQFGFYPKTTGGWIIDTYSVNYLHDVYGVKSHEITREQWGTDGYALYGGQVVSAYTPSKNWLFMPSLSDNESASLNIIRQTLSDPVRNYGDLTSGYTSQPNDYGRTKNFDYFVYLMRQVEKYSQPIAVLGLENSYEQKYQDMYEKQIDYINKVVEKKNIILPREIGKIQKQSYIIGTDYNDKSYSAYWVITSKYRVRFVKKNTSIQLTDFRIFDESMVDPYYSVPSGEKTVYWEAPFIFDSSKNGLHKIVDSISAQKGALFRFFGNGDWIKERTNPVVNEQFLQEINGIEFPLLKNGMNPSLNEKNGLITFRYNQQNGKEIIFSFYPDKFYVKGLKIDEFKIKGAIGKGTELLQEQKDNGVVFSPLLKPVNLMESTSESNIEKDIQEKRGEISIIYNASLSLIGRNPVRLVVVSKDIDGKPLRIKNMQITHTKGRFDSVKIHETEGHLGEFDGMYYVDIEQKSAGTYFPIISYDFEQKKLNPISFVFDCKKNISYCLSSPEKLFSYIKVKIGDLLNRR